MAATGQKKKSRTLPVLLTVLMVVTAVAVGLRMRDPSGGKEQALAGELAQLNAENDALRQQMETLRRQVEEQEDLPGAIEEQKAAGFARLAALEQKIRAGESDQKIAYLTFDDGPYDTVTDRVLDILAEKEVRATFFLRCRPNHEAQIRREIREVYRSSDSCIDELRRQQQWLSETFGVTPEIYRFPGGSPTARGEKAAIAAALAADGLGYVDWNCATGDGLPGELTRDMAYKNAIQSVGEQKIVVMLMHDYSAATTDALPQIIDTLREKGYLLMPLFRDSVMIKTA